MFFRKKQRPPAATAAGQAAPAPFAQQQEFVRIDFDMMLKGSVYKRRSGVVRQFGVTVNGSTRLVTSGDVVDRATYEALLLARAIRQPSSEIQLPKRSQSPGPGVFGDGDMPPEE